MSALTAFVLLVTVDEYEVGAAAKGERGLEKGGRDRRIELEGKEGAGVDEGREVAAKGLAQLGAPLGGGGQLMGAVALGGRAQEMLDGEHGAAAAGGERVGGAPAPGA